MNKEEIKLTEYLHNIIEENISLRKQNDELWKQKLEYIGRISDAIEYINDNVSVYAFNNKDLPHWEFNDDEIKILLRILKDSDVDA